MKNLEIIQNENGKQAVSCSQLFQALGLEKKYFNRWIEKNLSNNPFAIEGEDYIGLKCNQYTIRRKNRASLPITDPLTRHNVEIRTRNRQRKQDFVLTLDFAKRLAMMCRTEQGEKVRRYFLECEKIAINQDNSVIEALKQRISFYERIEQIKQIRIQLNKEIKQLRQFIETPPQIIQPVLKQLTLNFSEYEN